MLHGLPRPRPDLDTAPFWDGCAQGRFLVPTCGDCGRPRWPPGPMCPGCRSTATDWVAAAGRGRVYSWVVATHPVDPVLADQVPYVVAMIDLPEGIRVVGNVLGCEPAEVTAGMAVELVFENAAGDVRLPNFRACGQPEE